MLDLKEHLYKEYSGSEFKRLLGDDVNYFIKFMNNDDIHYNMIYKTGLNVDIEEFNPGNECTKGGIYFCHLQDYRCYVNSYGNYIRKVVIPDDARIYIEENKFKADKVILEEKEIKGEKLKSLLELYIKNNDVLSIIKNDGYVIEYIPQELRTESIMMEAVKQNGFAIQFIPQ
jgi:hypothetical protein